MKLDHIHDKQDQLETIETRMAEIDAMNEAKMDLQTLTAINSEYETLLEKRFNLKETLKADLEERESLLKKIANNEISGLKTIFPPDTHGGKPMHEENNVTEIRSFQKFLFEGTRNMSDVEMRALDLSGAASVLPVTIANKLIHDEAYSDLLFRATVFNQSGAGSMQIPIAANTSASWHTELAPGTEAAPTLTNLTLSGYELMRLMQISAATASMTTSDFENYMTDLLSAEVVATLETAFVTGNGIGKPKGLDSLTWDATNQKLTTNAQTPIAAADIAKAISLMPAKYARNAVVMCNTDMLYKMSQFEDTSGGYAFSMSDGATMFLGKEIVVNENIADDVVYIVDPKELYIRFASPIAVELDRSAGFTSASVYLRALTIVDSAWNPAACARVGLGA